MKYTYEEETTERKLETYEWDDIWWEQAPDMDKNRILVIGDSISCGYRRIITEELNNEMCVDGIGTSKSLDNPHFDNLIDYVMEQERNIKIIQFNNGLHGWHLSDEQYRKFYKRMLDMIIKRCESVKLIIALTTPVRNKENLNEFAHRNQRVLERNKIAVEIANEKNCIINDLYSLIEDKPELWTEDGVHLINDGYRLIAKHTAELIRKVNINN